MLFEKVLRSPKQGVEAEYIFPKLAGHTTPFALQSSFQSVVDCANNEKAE